MNRLNGTLFALGLVFIISPAMAELDEFPRPSATHSESATAEMKSQKWKVPSGFFVDDKGEPMQPTDEQAVQFLKNWNVHFPKGATASCKGSQLTVYNTPQNLKRVQNTLDKYEASLPDIYKVTWKVPRQTMKEAASQLKQTMKQRELEGFGDIKLSGNKITATGTEGHIKLLGKELEKGYQAERVSEKCLGKKGLVKKK